ncbi:MCM2/3/5 family-domain-containing protein [Polychytrium aggregatum]|uniref:MCM2/3/5 family-domain-containing protein n=1 Tax=Polychytrium aggregatum TaxID=110093 RepID=UPI0022FF1574|nr:MCM2/3/5 family-domain-containing protein [Polychytrium aggregatum]KAI9208361.1 MCM2/3/5 family-domain-containing protein [Polychytrium aggregatum]
MKMRRRDRAEALRSGRPAAFLDDDDEDDLRPEVTRRRRITDMDDALIQDGVPIEVPIESIDEIKGPLAEWVSMDGTRQSIRRHFHQFLSSYVEGGVCIYGERIKAMCEANGESLEVSYLHLEKKNAYLAYCVVNSPTEVLKIFDSVAFECVLSAFEEYENIKAEIHVRITDLPISDSLRLLRQSHLNTLIRVSGVVTRRSTVFPQLKYVKFDCKACGVVLGPFYQDVHGEIKINKCSNCQSKGPFLINSEETIYRNYQRLTLQESPGTVPAGRLPRHKEVVLLWDLVDSARPGEEIEVIGIYRNNYDVSLNNKNGFPVFSTVIEANYINKKEDQFASYKLTEEDERSIRVLASDPRIRQRIIKSIAPSIFGHEDLKTAIALAMFGGVAKNPQGKHRLRGDINVLLLGDPGTAKSQFLKYVEKTSHRAVYTTGQGASAVGLTASVHKDPITREWTLEGGALVMADKGVCLIDEFDKMNDQDRTSIHEAMEQQSISISKAGIVTTLQARCAVIAAANPIRGRYNPQIPFSQNVELTEPILSRFDILCVVKDTPDPILDESLARFVVNSHIRSHPSFSGQIETATMHDPEIIPQELLKKYIMYSREKVHPKIADIDQDKIARLYSSLRQQSMISGGIPITVRYLESIVRMAEAFARMHLRDIVRQDDIDRAIAVMIKSFVTAQKQSVRKSLERAFSGYISRDRDNDELLLHVLGDLVHERMQFNFVKFAAMPDTVEISVDELAAKVSLPRCLSIAPGCYAWYL